MLQKKTFILLGLAIFLGSTLNAQTFKYIGAAKCKMCHNKEETGLQYNKWVESKHSKAMVSLSSPKSLAYAKENGIADPTKEASCIKCHSTAGHIDAKMNATLTVEEGVSCESCHGPGSMYKSPTIMKSQERSIENGLVIPNKETCIKCHNKENPFYKPFDFDAAVAKIAHPNPAAAK